MWCEEFSLSVTGRFGSRTGMVVSGVLLDSVHHLGPTVGPMKDFADFGNTLLSGHGLVVGFLQEP